MLSFSYVLLVLAVVDCTYADGTDWVRPEYVLQQSNTRDTSTSAARSSISRGARTYSNAGPWTVTNNKGVNAASGDKHDYLSWAPYHWPDCNWCPKSKRTRPAHFGDKTIHNMDIEDSSQSRHDSGPVKNDSDVASFNARRFHATFPASHNRMIRSRRTFSLDTTESSPNFQSVKSVSQPSSVTPESDGVALPQAPLGVPPNQAYPIVSQAEVPTTTPGISTSEHSSADLVSVQAATPTSKSSSCTPSPTTSMAPSATWTTCPYEQRDGQVNPDVRTLVSPAAINNVAQSVLYNAITYALEGSTSGSQTAVNFIKTFFLDKETMMNPNMNYGQVVRGPGLVTGTFTGVLDLRGMVKIVNGLQILKASASPDWTPDFDEGLTSWSSEYSQWLTTSPIGQKARSRPNNHGTFYIVQLAALHVYLKDIDGAKALITDFMKNNFQDQIAKSGEQPFEAVRTRPFHYRCFNLEALIAVAKVADEIGMNFWSMRSKYGATIQTAVDFLLGVDPGKEDATELVPHVAAALAAYGDHQGKYKKFLSKYQYQDKPYWFYDQPSAFRNAPSSKSNKRDGTATGDVQLPEPDVFVCPPVFGLGEPVELDNGVFVTCDEVKPYFLGE